jgi:hypothetical protein
MVENVTAKHGLHIQPHEGDDGVKQEMLGKSSKVYVVLRFKKPAFGRIETVINYFK